MVYIGISWVLVFDLANLAHELARGLEQVRELRLGRLLGRLSLRNELTLALNCAGKQLARVRRC